MTEQRVIIHLTDEDYNEFGTLTVSSLYYRDDLQSKNTISHSISV